MNKVYLQEVKALKKLHKEDPKSFRAKINKADVMIGSNESLKFVEKIMKKK